MRRKRRNPLEGVLFVRGAPRTINLRKYPRPTVRVLIARGGVVLVRGSVVLVRENGVVIVWGPRSNSAGGVLLVRGPDLLRNSE